MRFSLRPISLYAIALSILLTGVYPFSAGAALLDEKEYQGAEAVVQELTQRRPLSQNIFVGVGRSPTPITTMLELLYPGSALNLPLSGAQDVLKMIEGSEKVSAEYGVEERLRPLLDIHFEKHLGPTLSRLKGKRLIFIDYVVQGSFMSALKLLDSYLKRNHPGVQWDYIAIMAKRSSFSNRLDLPEGKVIWLEAQHFELENRLIQERYDKISEFKKWSLADSESLLNPQHEAYRLEMQQRINAPLCRSIFYIY